MNSKYSIYKTSIHETTLKISSNNKDFFDFLSLSIDNKKIFEYDVTDKKDSVAINIDINFNNSLFHKDKNYKINNLRFCGSGLYRSKNRLFFKNNRITIDCNVKKNSFSISSNYNFRFDQKVRSLFLKNPQFKYNAFLYVYRFVILYPLMSYWSNFKKTSVVHASAILDKESNSVSAFVGLNGVGKSTLAYEISKMERYELFSDNFIGLINGRVFNIPEMLRLNKVLKEMTIQGRANNKNLYTSKSSKYNNKTYKCDNIIYISQNLNYELCKIKKIDDKSSLNLISNIGYFLKEYENFEYSSFLLHDKMNIDLNNYKKLVKVANSYTFQVSSKNCMTELIKILNK